MHRESSHFCYLKKLILALLIAVSCNRPSFGGDWPTWRGPASRGVSAETQTPTAWTPNENIRWKVRLPSESNSSPIVLQGRVFVTAGNKDGTVRSLFAFDQNSGSQLWQQGIEFQGREPKHATNPFCSASPVADADVVCASFGSAGMVGCDLDGKLLWHKELGRLEHVFGNATSPVLHDNLCILWCGPGSRQFVLAVDKLSGEEVWRREVPGGKPDFNAPSDCVGSWATPLIATVDGRDQLIVNAPEELMALDPRTGKKLWHTRGIGKLAYSSPAIWQDIVVCMSGYHGPVLAIRATGSGDVTSTHRVWQLADRQPQRIGSPLIVDGRLYCVNENGRAICLDIKTGRQLSESKSRVCGQTWSSLVQAGGKYYICSLSGETTVFDRDLQIVARNRLSDRIASSPAIAGAAIFIRGYDYLYCVANGDDDRAQ